jgi:cytoskeletal protein RodZ
MTTRGNDPTEPIVPPGRADGTTLLRRQTTFMWGNALATLLVVLVLGVIVAGAARSFLPSGGGAAASPSPSPTTSGETFTPRPLPSFTPTPTASPTRSPSPTPTATPRPTPTRTPAPPTKTPAPTKTP